MYLMVLSSTERQDTSPNPIPASERYLGIYPSLIKSMRRKGQFPKKCDLIFVTAHGIARADEKVPLADMPMTRELAISMREKNLETMKRILSSKNYDEIYVNLGQEYLRSIEGFEAYTKSTITYAEGVLGRKAVHMKQWIQEHPR